MCNKKSNTYIQDYKIKKKKKKKIDSKLKVSQIYMYSHGPITLGPMSISPSNICMVIYHRPIIAGPKSCKVHSHRHIAWRPNVYVVLDR